MPTGEDIPDILMNLEIRIEVDSREKCKLLAVLADLVPQKHREETLGRGKSERAALIFQVNSADPDKFLQNIAAAVDIFEHRSPDKPDLEIHVWNPALSEPRLRSEKKTAPFSPINGIRIVPAAGRPGTPAATVDIILEPSQAFGSGLHPSTRLCLHFIKRVAERDAERGLNPRSILDIGCGSGILTIAALRLGAAKALAFEIDPDAAGVARRNILLNHLAHAAKIMEASWQNAAGRHDLVLANLVPSVLFKAAPSLVDRLNTSGLLITAGFAASQNMKVLELFTRRGLRLLAESSSKGWGALLLEK